MLTSIIKAFSARIHSLKKKHFHTGFETRMPLRVHRDQPIMRTCGSLLGIGFIVVGVFSILGAEEMGAQINDDRAMGFGITAIIIGVIAVLCSLLVKDLSDIWCRQPRRWR